MHLALVEGDGDARRRRERLRDELRAAGHPVIEIELDDPIDLAGEMVRWEVATAFAGAVLGIDPFDQPNVEEAKERTRRVLAGAGDGRTAAGRRRPTRTMAASASPSHDAEQPRGAPAPDAPGARRRRTTSRSRRSSRRRPRSTRAIARIRAALARTGCATTAGYGPRFLHSTGQLHKGGPPTGVFLQLTSDHPVDRPIPGWPYTFGQLIDAQARGDREALRAHDRPVVHVHLGADLARGPRRRSTQAVGGARSA